jgi:hypothetical protein
MEIFIFYLLLIGLFLCILWAGGKILVKAGFDPRWVVLLLIPVINILMIWVFAFSDWPNIKTKSAGN